MLIDIGLQDISGIELLKSARSTGNPVPMLVLTPRDEIDSRITALDCGADDYVLKPFDIGELLARICAMLRRKSRLCGITSW